MITPEQAYHIGRYHNQALSLEMELDEAARHIGFERGEPVKVEFIIKSNGSEFLVCVWIANWPKGFGSYWGLLDVKTEAEGLAFIPELQAFYEKVSK